MVVKVKLHDVLLYRIIYDDGVMMGYNSNGTGHIVSCLRTSVSIKYLREKVRLVRYRNTVRLCQLPFATTKSPCLALFPFGDPSVPNKA